MLSTLLKTLLLPPAMQILMILGGLVLWKHARKVAITSIGAGLLSLWVLSLPVVSAYLHSGLESPFLADVMGATESALQPGDEPPTGTEVIVVLGAGRHYGAPEYGGDTVSHSALWRLRYAGMLAKRWDLPVVVSGGNVRSFDIVSEADMGVNFLRNELGVKQAWPEGNSRNTWENAWLTKVLLDEKGLSNIILVTHAYHMQRAVFSFQQAGFNPIPMPTGFIAQHAKPAFWLHWLPSATALQRSYLALHEYLGLLFYRMK
jgi:uncharacterized SAM-binding protein YcdF (DUF218 family)